MKKLFTLLTAAALCAFMYACKGDNNVDETEPKDGMHMTLQVSTSDVVRELANKPIDPRLTDAIDRAVEKQKTETNTDFITLFAKEAKDLPLYALFNAGDLKDKLYPGASNDDVIRAIREEATEAYERTFNILSKRIDRLGGAYSNIQKLPDSERILVELPGVKNQERVRKLLSSTARLEFWLVAKDSDAKKTLDAIDKFSADLVKAEGKGNNLYGLLTLIHSNSGAVSMVKLADTAAINRIFFKAQQEGYYDPKEGVVKFLWCNKPEKDGMMYLYAIEINDSKPLLDGGCIKNASQELDNYGYVIDLQMNSDGARDWKRITGENVGRCIAIVLDDRVYSAPVVMCEIAGGRSQISGNFTVEEAQDLANVLKSGKLPARIRVEE